MIVSDASTQAVRLSYGATSSATALGTRIRATLSSPTVQLADLDWNDADFGDSVNLHVLNGVAANDLDVEIKYYHINRQPGGARAKREV